MIVTAENGSQLVVADAPNRNRLLDTYWRRIEPVGDAGDLVLIKGVDERAVPTEEGTLHSTALVITPSTFGAVPAGWGSHVEAYRFDDFAEEYAPASAPSAAVEAVQSAAATAEREAARLREQAERLAEVRALADTIRKERS